MFKVTYLYKYPMTAKHLRIGEYSAKKIYFSLASEKIVKKFPHIFYFQEWKIVQNCTFLGKNCQNLYLFGEKLSKFALFGV